MGIFRPIVERVQGANREGVAIDHSNDKPITPMDLVSASRPLYFAPKIAGMLLRGERYVTPYMMGFAASDGEGTGTRIIDKHFPDSGWGSTEHGEIVDVACDTTGLLIVCGAALIAPKVSVGGKAAIAGVLGTETKKAVWATTRSMQFRRAGGEGRLKIPVSMDGKEAMVEKLAAVTAALATNDVDPGAARTALTASALYFAGSGGLRGERARASYEEQAQQIISELTDKTTSVTPPYDHPMAHTLDLGGGRWRVIGDDATASIAQPGINTNPTRRGVEGDFR